MSTDTVPLPAALDTCDCPGDRRSHLWSCDLAHLIEAERSADRSAECYAHGKSRSYASISWDFRATYRLGFTVDLRFDPAETVRKDLRGYIRFEPEPGEGSKLEQWLHRWIYDDGTVVHADARMPFGASRDLSYDDGDARLGLAADLRGISWEEATAIVERELGLIDEAGRPTPEVALARVDPQVALADVRSQLPLAGVPQLTPMAQMVAEVRALPDPELAAWRALAISKIEGLQAEALAEHVCRLLGVEQAQALIEDVAVR